MPTAGDPHAERPPLPDRNVTPNTIEDAYVAFIFHCNPAVPFTSKTAPLREALHNLPRSAGKTFAIFTLFLLVRDLELKVLKTWAELALQLGVEPPDVQKGESSQKIQQYAVRLKRWMHSMHVDAFFEYLLGIPSPYWTEIPTLSTLVDRDGVAPADDMAIRALVPNTRPTRGRKRIDEDDQPQPPASRPKTDLWDAHTLGQHQPPSIEAPSGPSSADQTTLYSPASSTHPHEEQGIWELRPSVQPTASKPPQRRHGAKVVSSAWRSRGLGAAAAGKTRGRPPLAKCSVGESSSPFDEAMTPSVEATSDTPSIASSSNATTSPAEAAPTQHMESSSESTEHKSSLGPSTIDKTSNPPGPSEDPRRPERSTVNTPVFPPVTTPDYPHTTTKRSEELFRPQGYPVTTNTEHGETATGHTYDLDAAAQGASSSGPGFFDSFTDRTNIDAVMAFQVNTTLEADWFDEQGSRIPPCDLDEAVAISTSMLEQLFDAAPSQSGFLINLSALLGSRMLMTTTKLQMRRLATAHGRRHYACSWEYRLGHIKGTYQMTHSLETKRLKPSPSPSEEQMPKRSQVDSDDEEESADVWRRRYENALKVVQDKEEALTSLRDSMYNTLRR
ncbi:ARS binding protein 2-domain-containing protein [Plectosphaerella plurivora]|uniref:ARS binding protein 2-domain-containing protein n=1 Tax=Plectosphaerella plurivora TaxID=936078 RepID=A0A9P8V5G8_9PEZI|nr:ARS binding protein 2-domain-containing protein [Plectosphaerella plurivora]